MFGRSVIVAIALILLLGTFAVFTGIPAAPPVEQGTGLYTIQVQDQHLSVRQTRVLNRRTYALINYLLQAHITHIYSDYWTCNRLIFQSRERIICSVLKDNLRTGQNRYPPYHAIVAADQHATFIFQTHSFSANLFAQRVQKIPGYRHFGHVTLEGYEIFQPR